jgi:hypothetical protein
MTRTRSQFVDGEMPLHPVGCEVAKAKSPTLRLVGLPAIFGWDGSVTSTPTLDLTLMLSRGLRSSDEILLERSPA